MKNVAGMALCSLLILSSCSSNVKNAAREQKKYEKAKAALAEKEKKNPLAFLTVTAENKKKYYRANCSAWKNIKQGNC